MAFYEGGVLKIVIDSSSVSMLLSRYEYLVLWLCKFIGLGSIEKSEHLCWVNVLKNTTGTKEIYGLLFMLIVLCMFYIKVKCCNTVY